MASSVTSSVPIGVWKVSRAGIATQKESTSPGKRSGLAKVYHAFKQGINQVIDRIRYHSDWAARRQAAARRRVNHDPKRIDMTVTTAFVTKQSAENGVSDGCNGVYQNRKPIEGWVFPPYLGLREIK